MNSLVHQPPQTVRANGIELCYEIFGDADAEPMLLIMGLGAQMILWDDDFCRQLADRGFRVIRFDNRDIGKSSKLSGGKRLTALELLKLRFLKIPVSAPYKLSDMAQDTIGLMDALKIRSAHLVGASMGGMIAQEIAITFPERVRSLTSIMSTTGNPRVPPPTREAAAMLMAPPVTTKPEYLERFAQTWKILRVGSFPEDEALDRTRAERSFERGLNPAGVGRQLRAILASGSRKERLRSVKAPTLVIHGTLDPLVRPEGGLDTAASIAGAKLLMIEGMGHALPIPMWPQIISAIDQHAHDGRRKAAAR
ncbi:MAG: alpha/beta hydrolase [Bradyrhizobium sp.]|nr:alpha/beta hydrolase [Bradyrhizobium sp.]